MKRALTLMGPFIFAALALQAPSTALAGSPLARIRIKTDKNSRALEIQLKSQMSNFERVIALAPQSIPLLATIDISGNVRDVNLTYDKRKKTVYLGPVACRSWEKPVTEVHLAYIGLHEIAHSVYEANYDARFESSFSARKDLSQAESDYLLNLDSAHNEFLSDVAAFLTTKHPSLGEEFSHECRSRPTDRTFARTLSREDFEKRGYTRNSHEFFGYSYQFVARALERGKAVPNIEARIYRALLLASFDQVEAASRRFLDTRIADSRSALEWNDELIERFEQILAIP